MPDAEKITITKSYYDTLKKAYDKLMALQDAGVDNWEGYSYAMEVLGDDEEED